MITSRSNPKVKQVRALLGQAKARREQNAFAVEGVRLAEEALKAGWPPQLALYTPGLNERGMAVIVRAEGMGCPIETVSEGVMKSISDTQSPQGVLLVLPMRELPSPEKLDLVLIADEISDPGNLGTLLRSAAAVGAQGALLTPGTTDAYAPKVLRAGMGAQFRLPVHKLAWPEIEALCQSHELHVLLAAAGEGTVYTDVDLRKPLALIVGGEAAGAGEAARKLAKEAIHIPMPGGSESLNAAMAGAVLLFEALRQRSQI